MPIATTDGWSDLPVHPSARLIYVSASGSDSSDGLSEGAPKLTLAAAKAMLRDGQADRLLLKRGDTWDGEHISTGSISGLSAAYPMVIGAYGTGARPVIDNPDSGTSIDANGTGAFIAVIDLEVTASGWDGNAGNPYGIVFYGQWSDILIEGCYVHRNFVNISLQGTGGGTQHANLTVRRNIIADAFKVGAAEHSQGVFIGEAAGGLVEENVIDHNGWNEGVSGADPTVFRHNVYLAPESTSGFTVRKNIVARGAATGLRSCGDTCEYNLLPANPNGIAMGADNQVIRYNVVLDSRNIVDVSNEIGGGIVGDCAGPCEIYGNVLALRSTTGNSNTYALQFHGPNSGTVNVHDNIVYDWFNSDGQGLSIYSDFPGLTFASNDVQMVSGGWCCKADPNGTAHPVFAGNRWYSGAADQRVFSTPGGSYFVAWATFQAESGETGSYGAVSYTDPGRGIPGYMATLSGTQTLAGFLAQARLQERGNWRAEYEALTVVNWVRAGYDLAAVGLPAPPRPSGGSRARSRSRMR